eukprot:583660-Prymnesium_polylepis.1
MRRVEARVVLHLPDEGEGGRRLSGRGPTAQWVGGARGEAREREGYRERERGIACLLRPARVLVTCLEQLAPLRVEAGVVLLDHLREEVGDRMHLPNMGVGSV